MRSLIWLSLLHIVVDAYAMLLEPLWPSLPAAFPQAGAWIPALMTLAMLVPNLSQAIFGYCRDRWPSPWLVWAAPLLAAIALPLITVWDNPLAQAALVLVGFTAIGAFHPEGVICAGTLVPGYRTRSISLFLVGGTIGMGVGPLLSAWCVGTYGWAAAGWLAVPGAALVLLLSWGITPPAAVASQTAPPRLSLREFARQHGRQALWLLALSTCRALPAVGMTKAVAFTLDALPGETDKLALGFAQSLFLGAGSAGMLWLAGRFRRGTERATLKSSAWLAIPILLVLPLCPQHYNLFVVLLVLAGLVLNGTSASLISYGQQLFPHSAGIASALTMGIAWGCGGLLVAVLIPMATAWGHPEWLFWMYIPPLVFCGLARWEAPPGDASAASA